MNAVLDYMVLSPDDRKQLMADRKVERQLQFVYETLALSRAWADDLLTKHTLNRTARACSCGVTAGYTAHLRDVFAGRVPE